MRAAAADMSDGAATYDLDASLLGARDADAPRVEPADRVAWRALHAASFLLGGSTFIAGTALLLSPTRLAATLSALLYTIGSVGFVAVDIQEFFTFTSPLNLRANIALSALGSTFYIAGSVAYFPQLAGGAAAGTLLFIAGSAIIATSEVLKIARLACATPRAPRVASAIGVEAGACAGAALFLAGSLGIGAGWAGTSVIGAWLGGSAAFTVGGLFLAFRHFAQGLS